METIEGNRLIAEFMDGVFKDLAYIRDTFPVIEYKVETHGLYCHPIKDLKYHSSWDWLMPAWRKLYLWIWERPERHNELREWYDKMEQALTKVLIELAWKTLVEGILWYNTTKPQPNAK